MYRRFSFAVFAFLYKCFNKSSHISHQLCAISDIDLSHIIAIAIRVYVINAAP